MKITIIFLLIGLNLAYSSDSLYIFSSTLTNLDSLRDIQHQNIEWDSITTSTNHFIGENDSWYLLQVVGKESSGSFNVDTINVSDWKSNYYDYFQTIIDTSQTNIPPYDTLFNAIEYYSRTDTIPIIMFISEINTFCESALEDSTIYLDSNNIFEINSSSTTTKYCKEVIFMSTPSMDKYFGNLFKFIWSDEFFTINNYNDIDSLLIDFDDGNGFIHIPKDSIYQVMYEIPGLKTITTKAKFINSNELISYSKLYVNGEYLNVYGIPVGGDRLDDIDLHYEEVNKSWDKHIRIGEDVDCFFDPVFGGDISACYNLFIEAYIYYGCGNNIFDKPFIIIEGIDQLNQMYPWTWYDTWYMTGKEYDIDKQSCQTVKKIGMIEILEIHSREDPDDVNEKGIFSKLIEEGYDVVIVNHGNGGGHVKTNGEYVAQLIKRINEEKVGDNKSIVMGASMGGLTGRIGLALLEQEIPSYDHQVSHFITVDSPHRGAWINAATQIHLQASERSSKVAKGIQNELDRLNSPASKNLLIHYFTDNKSQYSQTSQKKNWWKSDKSGNNQSLIVNYNTPTDISELTINLRKEFQKYLDDTLGYPENLIKIAVSNGSFNNSNQNIDLSPYLFDADVTDVGVREYGKWWWSDFTFKLNSFPSYGNLRTVVNSNYDLAWPAPNLKIRFNITNNDPNIDFCFENISGGGISLIKEFEGKFLTYDYCTHKPTDSDIRKSQRVSAFIPTASSIDLRKNSNFDLDHQYQFFNDNIRELLNGEVENVEVYSPFDYIYGLDYNSDHAFAYTDMGNGLSPTEYSTRRSALVAMIDDLLENNFKDIYIQNETIDDTRAYKTNYSINVGRNVMSNISSLVNKANTAIGDVVFTDNSDVLMEAAEEIIFANGTYIYSGDNSGGKLHAKIIPKVTLDCEVTAKVVYNHKKEKEEINTIQSEVNIFPNPVRSEFQIKVNSNDNIRRMYVVNLTGQLVIDLTSSIKDEFKSYDFLLESSNLSSGTYVFVIEGDKETVTRNFVVTK